MTTLLRQIVPKLVSYNSDLLHANRQGQGLKRGPGPAWALAKSPFRPSELGVLEGRGRSNYFQNLEKFYGTQEHIYKDLMIFYKFFPKTYEKISKPP